MPAWMYLLRLRSGRLYPGATKDLNRRYRDHLEGKGGRTTRMDPPVALAYIERFNHFAEARQREAQIKRWPAKKKAALVAGDITRLRQLATSRD